MSNVKKVLSLTIICAVCAVLIAAVYLVTSPITAKNKEAKEIASLEKIYQGVEFEKMTVDGDGITGKWTAYKEDSSVVGYVYSVTGKNDYGTVSVMFGVNLDGSIEKVIITENTESYATKLNKHVQDAYSSKVENLDNVDVVCGATFGAKLVKELIQIGLDEFLESTRLNKGGLHE